jgi:hypothetical protein
LLKKEKKKRLNVFTQRASSPTFLLATPHAPPHSHQATSPPKLKKEVQNVYRHQCLITKRAGCYHQREKSFAKSCEIEK